MNPRTKPDPAPISFLGQAFNYLENRGVSYPFLTCSLAAGAKFSASFLSQPLKQAQQIKNMSAHPAPLSFASIVKSNLQRKHSFFTGGALNAEKAGLREYTRFYLLTRASKKVEKHLPVSWQSSDLIKQSLNGTLIAGSDVIFYGPFDRLSNIQVTYEHRTGKRLSIYDAYKQIPQGETLWRGSALNMMKLTYGWISFLTQHGMAVNFLNRYGVGSSALTIAAADSLIAIMNAPVMNAFDVMYNKVTNDKPLDSARPLDAAKHILKTEGCMGFWKGTPQRALLSIFTVVGRGWTIQRLAQLEEERNLVLSRKNS